uniref:Membrane protein BRI3 n=1 Tax=Steinernema glaseri TaxID=37863 RepID=A0A1I7Y4L0_9BILA
MIVMAPGKVPLPSAPPPPEDESSSSSSSAVRQPAEAPQPQPPQAVTTSHVSAPAPPHPVPPPGFYTEAPPSYQAALTSPVNPPYPMDHTKMPQPNAATPMNHPAPPYQPQMLNPNMIPISAPVVIHTTATVQPRGDCAVCQVGNVRNETDFCCLLCLIIIAVFTFPFGLLLLCCIPCTVRKRCNRCRRIY